MPPAVNTPAMGLRAPASKLTTERENPPVTGKPPLTPDARLAAPRPTSSALLSTRWRRLAARVWATDTDSTKPIRLISNAGSASWPHTAASNAGKDSPGRPPGMAPTTATPRLCRSPAATATVVPITASTGPALASRSASMGGSGVRASSRFSGPRAHSKKSRAAPPTSRVVPLTPAAPRNADTPSSQSVSPCIGIPSRCLSWLAAISSPEAVIKPLITEWLSRLATQPRRSSPMAIRKAPDSSASITVAAR